MVGLNPLAFALLPPLRDAFLGLGLRCGTVLRRRLLHRLLRRGRRLIGGRDGVRGGSDNLLGGRDGVVLGGEFASAHRV